MFQRLRLTPLAHPDNAGGTTPPASTTPPAIDPPASTTPPAADPPASTTPPAADPPASTTTTPPADPPASTDDTDDTDDEGAIDWQEEARSRGREAAKYRTQRNRYANAAKGLSEALPESARPAFQQLQTAKTEPEQAAALDALKAALAAPGQPTPSPATEAETRAATATQRALIAEQAAEIGVPMAAIQAARELMSATDEAGIKAAIAKLAGHLKPATPGSHRPPADTTTAPTLEQQIDAARQAKDTNQSIRLKTAQLLPKN